MNPILQWIKNNSLKIFAALIVMMLAYLIITHFLAGKSAKSNDATVETIVLAPQPGIQRWQAVGIVKAAHQIIITPEITTGTIDSIAAASGQTVKQGDILINIRHADIDASLQKDQAALAAAKLTYQRKNALLSSHSISKEDISQALSAYQQAVAAVAGDQALLAKYIIRAPFAGTLGIWQVDIGQQISANDKLVSLTQLSPAWIDFSLPPAALGAIKVGDNIRFTTSSFPGRNWVGKITSIDPQLDTSTRSLQLRAQVDNHDNKLVPSLYGTILVELPLPPQLLIPQQAVMYDPKGASVYIVKQNKANPQAITLGEHIGDDVVVSSGLQAGDEVITAGMMKLFPDSPVNISHRVTQSAVTPPTHS